MKYSPNSAAMKGLSGSDTARLPGQHLPDALARVRALHRDHGEIAARRDGQRARALGGERREPGDVLLCGGGVDDEAKPVLAQKIDDEIVEHAAVVPEQARVERLAGNGKLVDVVRERVAQEIAYVSAAKIDREHVRHVEHAGIAAHRMVLLELRAVGHRHVPSAEVDHLRARGAMHGMKRSLAKHGSPAETKRAKPSCRFRPVCPFT